MLPPPPSSPLFLYTTLFRSNLFNQRGAVGGVFRTIPFVIRTFSDLGLPPVLEELCNKPRGSPRSLKVDRKSTRLNSSHEWISYAVFCLKKKKKSISDRYNS